MAKTVVGLFASDTEAQNVKTDLVKQGYASETIRVMSNNGQAAAASHDAETANTGFAASISNFFRSLTGSETADEKQYTEGVKSGGVLLAISVADDQAGMVADLLERHGARNVDEQGGSHGQVSTGLAGSGADQTLNVVEEELQVGKRQVQRGGVRVYSHVTERPVEENITLREEHVHVERRPVDRAATAEDFAAFKEGSIELTETAEEAIVSKTSRVVEEVLVRKDVSERQQTVKDTVRRTDVEVETIGAGKSGKQTGYSQFEPGFRKHFASNYAHTGDSYEAYAPAYQYGYNLAGDPRYSESDWNTVESSARSDWSRQGSGTWENMKAAVRQGWDQVHGTSTAHAR